MVSIEQEKEKEALKTIWALIDASNQCVTHSLMKPLSLAE